jgi:hypothetical protein
VNVAILSNRDLTVRESQSHCTVVARKTGMILRHGQPQSRTAYRYDRRARQKRAAMVLGALPRLPAPSLSQNRLRRIVLCSESIVQREISSRFSQRCFYWVPALVDIRPPVWEIDLHLT